MPVEKNRRFSGRCDGFGINEGMKLRGYDLDGFKACGAEMVCDPIRGSLDVRLMLALGTDRGNAKEFVEFLKMLIAAIVQEFGKIHVRPPGARIRFLAKANADQELKMKIAAAVS
jgi:hypothetical protein